MITLHFKCQYTWKIEGGVAICWPVAHPGYTVFLLSYMYIYLIIRQTVVAGLRPNGSFQREILGEFCVVTHLYYSPASQGDPAHTSLL